MEISLKRNAKVADISITKFLKTISLVLMLCTCTNFTVNAKTLEEEKKITKLHTKAKTELAKHKAMKQQIDCLARNIYYESASEPYEGKLAVAQVTMNRVKSSRFPGSVCSVVYQKSVIRDKMVCQFSWTCVDVRAIKINSPRWEESRKVAKKFLIENYTYDKVRQAYYFHGDYIEPGWQLRRIAHIGRHIFYAGAG
jgi:spore germination cell wall hydrolase CwlJ-like protein